MIRSEHQPPGGSIHINVANIGPGPSHRQDQKLGPSSMYPLKYSLRLRRPHQFVHPKNSPSKLRLQTNLILPSRLEIVHLKPISHCSPILALPVTLINVHQSLLQALQALVHALPILLIFLIYINIIIIGRSSRIIILIIIIIIITNINVIISRRHYRPGPSSTRNNTFGRPVTRYYYYYT